MSKSLRNILIAFGAIVLVVLSCMITSSVNEHRAIKDAAFRAAAEQRITDYAIKYKSLQVKSDSLADVISEKQTLIDWMENNPQIIIQNNEKAHLDIDRLNAYNSIVRFTIGASAYENNRKRYDLHRFNPNH